MSRPFILYGLALAAGAAPLQALSSPAPVGGMDTWPRLFTQEDLELELGKLVSAGGADAVAVVGPVRDGGAFCWGVVAAGSPAEVLVRLPERLAVNLSRVSVDMAAAALEGPGGDAIFDALDDSEEG